MPLMCHKLSSRIIASSGTFDVESVFSEEENKESNITTIVPAIEPRTFLIHLVELISNEEN